MKILLQISRTSMFLIALIMCASLTSRAQQASAPEKSLYQRLGGYDAIAAVSDDFLARLDADKTLSHFLDGLSKDSLKELRQHFVDFICEAAGGPCRYTGRDMKTAHAGLGISENDWKVGVEALIATLEKLKVPKREQDEVLAAVNSLKKDIVEK